jgi:hypothetical protein
MKKYRVSIAASIPANFEIVVKASTPEAAFNKAVDEYWDGKGDFQEIMDRPTLVPGEHDITGHERHAPGVYVAELKANGEETEV